jgi:hypothetical protein
MEKDTIDKYMITDEEITLKLLTNYEEYPYCVMCDIKLKDGEKGWCAKCCGEEIG